MNELIYFNKFSINYFFQNIMKKYIYLILCFFFVGCAVGKDGDDGKVLISTSWTSDIQSIDLSLLLKQPPIIYYPNVYYEAFPNRTKNVYWMSNNTTYYYPITVPINHFGKKGYANGEDGEDGEDILRNLFFSGNIVIFQRISGLENKNTKNNIHELKNFNHNNSFKGILKESFYEHLVKEIPP